MKGNEKVQVGFTVDLYAEVPMDKGPGAERIEESARIWERLRAIVEKLVPPEGGRARVEIEPRRTAAYLRPENELKPEVGLRARVFHGDDYFASVTNEERTRLNAVEHRLAEMGLRAGHW